MKQRLHYIDIARAFAILFIVLGHTLVHSEHCALVYKFIYSFNVAMFFVLSGLTFKINIEEKFTHFLSKKLVRIMIPYFVWAILFIIPYLLFGGDVNDSLGTNGSFSLNQIFADILYGNGDKSALKQNTALWFLPALFSMEIIFYFVIRLSYKALLRTKIFILAIIVLIGYIANAFLPVQLPWGINTTLTVGAFFYIGYLFREYKLLEKNSLVLRIYFIFPILIIGLLACFTNQQISWKNYNYGNLTLALISGLCVSLFVIYISILISKNKVLEYFGRNTMGILIFHKLAIVIFQTKLGRISDLLMDSNIFVEVILSILIVILSVICSLIATAIVRRILPVLIGESRKQPVFKKKQLPSQSD